MTTIQALVDRFLGWKLPPTFGPDAGIKFTPSNGMTREEAYAKPGWWPIGTNLFNADEARAMLDYLLGTPTRMWAIAKQNPDRDEVSMFLTSSEATAKEYERLGWTARPVDVLPAGSEADELSLRELDSLGRAYFNGPLNSNEEMFGRAVERAVRRRLLGAHGVAIPAKLVTHCPWCAAPVSVADEPYCANADCRWNNGGTAPELLSMTVADVLRIVDANESRQDIERALIANLPSNGGPRASGVEGRSNG